MKKRETISIVTVSFNSAQTIQDTFDSIRSQDYESIEYIVVDGKSTDQTVEIIKRNKDIISTWISEKDRGIYDAMNKGINLASGQVIGILNSDDIYEDKKTISAIMNAFNRSPETEIVYGNLNYVSYDLKRTIRKWRTTDFKRGSFRRGWHPPHPAFFVRNKTYIKCGLYDTNYKIASDFDFMLRVFEVYQCKSVFINMVITKMRIGGESNKTISNILKGNLEISRAFKKYNIQKSPLYYFFRFLPKLYEHI